MTHIALFVIKQNVVAGEYIESEEILNYTEHFSEYLKNIWIIIFWIHRLLSTGYFNWKILQNGSSHLNIDGSEDD